VRRVYQVVAALDAVRLGRGQAAGDVRAAHALDPQTGRLPRLGAALANGQVHRGHVDAAARVLEQLPVKVLGRVHPETGRPRSAGWTGS
jgi:hypothetical protein